MDASAGVGCVGGLCHWGRGRRKRSCTETVEEHIQLVGSVKVFRIPLYHEPCDHLYS